MTTSPTGPGSTPGSVRTGTLATPDARLYYELRGSGPLLAIVGSPMHAAPFAPLADALAADHTILTMDPRGHFGSSPTDPAADSTPELRAEDLAALLRHVDAGPAAVFGSSGGAITTLALVQAHPDLVHTTIAHEPPLAQLLPDRERRLATIDDIAATYVAGDRLGAIRAFMAFADFVMPEEAFLQAFAGEKPAAEVASERFFYLREMRATTRWSPNLDALRSTTTRVIVGIGEASADQLCDRTSRALTAELKTEPVMFPGGHAGFMENPTLFAGRVREVVG